VNLFNLSDGEYPPNKLLRLGYAVDYWDGEV